MGDDGIVPDPQPLMAHQWAPSGNGADGNPSYMMSFLADLTEGTRYGHGHGPGASESFGYRGPGGQRHTVTLRGGEWAVRYSDGLVRAVAVCPPGVLRVTYTP